PQLEGGTVVVHLVDPANPTIDLATQPLAVTIASPSDYVDAKPHFQPGDKNKLTVEVRMTRDIPGDPCRVEMVLSKEYIPGYLGAGEGKRADVVGVSQPLTLDAKNLEFSPDVVNEEGTLLLSVDGCERALIYRVFFPRQGAPQLPTRK